jgi:hypothetical protein
VLWCPPIIPSTDVFNELQKIKSNASGPDSLPGLLIKKMAYILADPLTVIFNRCLSSAYFPIEWKKANVIPIEKKDGSFRPISLLCVFSKVFEKLILKFWLIPSIKRKPSSSQFAFLPMLHCGTANALTTMRLWTLSKLDRLGGVVRHLLVDFCKAFDKVSHYQLLLCLESRFKFSPLLLNCIKSFLRDRMQRVSFDCTQFTEYSRVSSGVPQGSILGPILFALFVDDINDAFLNSIFCVDLMIVVYADDLTALLHVPKGCNDFLQNVADIISCWAHSKKLAINLSKCQILDAHKSSNHEMTNIYIDNTLIVILPEVKVLGLWLQSDLRWKKQFDHMNSRCRSASFVVRLLLRNGMRGNLSRFIFLSDVILLASSL